MFSRFPSWWMMEPGLERRLSSSRAHACIRLTQYLEGNCPGWRWSPTHSLWRGPYLHDAIQAPHSGRSTETEVMKRTHASNLTYKWKSITSASMGTLLRCLLYTAASSSREPGNVISVPVSVSRLQLFHVHGRHRKGYRVTTQFPPTQSPFIVFASEVLFMKFIHIC